MRNILISIEKFVLLFRQKRCFWVQLSFKYPAISGAVECWSPELPKIARPTNLFWCSALSTISRLLTITDFFQRCKLVPWNPLRLSDKFDFRISTFTGRYIIQFVLLSCSFTCRKFICKHTSVTFWSTCAVVCHCFHDMSFVLSGRRDSWNPQRGNSDCREVC